MNARVSGAPLLVDEDELPEAVELPVCRAVPDPVAVELEPKALSAQNCVGFALPYRKCKNQSWRNPR